MLGWADVPDSDWGDFRCRRAVDVSSFLWCQNDVVISFVEGLIKVRAWLIGLVGLLSPCCVLVCDHGGLIMRPPSCTVHGMNRSNLGFQAFSGKRILMYPDHLQNWLDFGHGLLIFLIFVMSPPWLHCPSDWPLAVKGCCRYYILDLHAWYSVGCVNQRLWPCTWAVVWHVL